jgi:hypothetical protein
MLSLQRLPKNVRLFSNGNLHALKAAIFFLFMKYNFMQMWVLIKFTGMMRLIVVTLLTLDKVIHGIKRQFN